PDHLGAVARDLDLSWSMGLRNGITLSGKGTGYDLTRLANDVGGVIADGRTHKVLIVEMQNEFRNGGDGLDVLERMARAIRSKIPNLIGVSTPASEADVEQIRDVLRAVGGHVFIRHTERAGD